MILVSASYLDQLDVPEERFSCIIFDYTKFNKNCLFVVTILWTKPDQPRLLPTKNSNLGWPGLVLQPSSSSRLH